MKYRNDIMKALTNSGFAVESINCSLNNVLVLDNQWLCEIDSDGGFAAELSYLDKSLGRNKRKLIVFQEYNEEQYSEMLDSISQKVMSAIDDLEKCA